MYGIDISEEMLEIAEKKTEEYGDKIILIEQDITALDFDIYEIDTVIAANDTFNYILEKEKIRQLLAYLYPRLKNGGQLVFDISSKYKLRHTLGGNTFGESFENMAYLWENYYDEALEQVFMEINIFEKQGELYERLTESHVQKAYEMNEIFLYFINYREHNSSIFPSIKILVHLSMIISGAPFVKETTLSSIKLLWKVVIIFLVESKGISSILG